MSRKQSSAPEPDFTVAIGNEVHGTNGKLGEVERVVVDADSDRISELVVKHGLPLIGKERMVPLSHVTRADGSVLYVDLDQEQFEELSGFDPEKYRQPDPDYTGPPGFDARSGYNYPYESTVAAGPLLFLGFGGGKVLGYPGGESAERGRLEPRPAIAEGDDVLSSDYEKVGEVGALSIDEKGFPVSLSVKQGFIFKSETEIPVEWISELSDRGVVLGVAKAEVERYMERT